MLGLVKEVCQSFIYVLLVSHAAHGGNRPGPCIFLHVSAVRAFGGICERKVLEGLRQLRPFACRGQSASE